MRWFAPQLSVALVVFTGCVPVPSEFEPIAFALDAEGVQLLDRRQRIDFGRTDHSTKSAMTKLIGAEPNGRRFCGAISSDVWPNGTELFYEGDAFRGWRKGKAEAGIVCPRV